MKQDAVLLLALIAVLGLLIGWKEAVREPEVAPAGSIPAQPTPSEQPGTAPSERSRPAPAGPTTDLRVVLHPELNSGESGPSVRLRLRGKDADGTEFDWTSEPIRTARRRRVTLSIPARRPQLPIEGTLISSDYCLAMQVDDFLIRSISSDFQLSLTRRREIAVRVVAEADAAPVAGVTVTHLGGGTAGQTDADGRLTVPAAATRGALLACDAEGWEGALVGVPAGDSERTVTMRPATAAHWPIELQDGAGEPLADHIVILRWLEVSAVPPGTAADAIAGFLRPPRGLPTPGGPLRSDSSGRVQVPLPASGRVEIEVSDPQTGLREKRSLTVVAGETAEATVLRFASSSLLRVELRAGGEPARGCPFELVVLGDNGPQIVQAGRTAETGRVELRALDGERQFVVARPLSQPATVVEVGESGDLVLDLAEVSTVKFTMIALVQILDDVARLVEVVDADSGIVLTTIKCNAAGAFSTSLIPAGRTVQLRRALTRDRFLLEEPLLLESGVTRDLGDLPLESP